MRRYIKKSQILYLKKYFDSICFGEPGMLNLNMSLPKYKDIHGQLIEHLNRILIIYLQTHQFLTKLQSLVVLVKQFFLLDQPLYSPEIF